MTDVSKLMSRLRDWPPAQVRVCEWMLTFIEDGSTITEAVQLAAAALAKVMAQENARLREHILRRGWWQEAPCVLCGYEGEGYYQPATHACAGLAAALAEEKP